MTTPHTDSADELARALAELICHQAEDEGLWFNAMTAPEAYLQRALRDLHEAAERALRTRPAPGAAGERPSDGTLRKMWRDAGGRFYGPNVETGTMPESELLPFLRALYTAPAPAQRMSEEQERAAFEAWFEEWRRAEWNLLCADRGQDPTTAWAQGLKSWMQEGWQARAAWGVKLEGDAA